MGTTKTSLSGYPSDSQTPFTVVIAKSLTSVEGWTSKAPYFFNSLKGKDCERLIKSDNRLLHFFTYPGEADPIPIVSGVPSSSDLDNKPNFSNSERH